MLSVDTKDAVYAALAAHGAPLAGRAPAGSELDLETALVKALELAHSDSTLLRVLPLVLARNVRAFRWRRLKDLATDQHRLPELGMVLELAATLTNLFELRAALEELPAPDPREPTPFFPVQSRFELELLRKRTPAAARRWGFLLNMPEDSFSSLLQKYAPPSPVRPRTRALSGSRQ